MTDWREVIEDKNLNGIIIATPPREHALIMNLAIKKGLSILVEKPWALSTREADEILQLCDRNCPGFLMVGHTHLYNPAFKKIAASVHEIGNFEQIISVAGANRPIHSDISTLWDWAPHDISMMVHVSGCPEKLSAKICRQRMTKFGLAEDLQVTCDYSNARRASIRISTMIPKTRFFAVLAGGRWWVYDDILEHKAWVAEGNMSLEAWQENSIQRKPLSYDPGTPLEHTVQEFTSCIDKKMNGFRNAKFEYSVVALIESIENYLLEDSI